MNLGKYQQLVMNGMFVDEAHSPLVNAVLGLNGEAGEVADLVKKSQYVGRTLNVNQLLDELGDVLWYLTYAAGYHGFTIEELASLNMEKLSARHPQLYPKELL